MGTHGIGTAIRLGLGGLSLGLIGTGLWGLGRPEDTLGRMICSEAHCVEAVGLYQASLLVGTLLLAVLLLTLGGRDPARAPTRPSASRLSGPPAAQRRG